MCHTQRLYFLFFFAQIAVFSSVKKCLLSGRRLQITSSACGKVTTNSTAVMHLHCKTSLALSTAGIMKKNEVIIVKYGDLMTPLLLLFLSFITQPLAHRAVPQLHDHISQ